MPISIVPAVFYHVIYSTPVHNNLQLVFCHAHWYRVDHNGENFNKSIHFVIGAEVTHIHK
jgi:hypothetical protein